MNQPKAQVIKSDEPRREAANILKGDGRYQVLWHTCRLIYGSADLVKDNARPDEMEVFGIEGRIRTNCGMVQAFRAQHCFAFDDPRIGYYTSLSMRAEPEGHPLTLRIELDPGELDGGRWYFRCAVESMTRCLIERGPLSAMRWWLDQQEF